MGARVIRHWQPNEDERFAQLRSIERDGRLPRRNPLATSFARIPLPEPDAPLGELVEYQRGAHRAGVTIASADLTAFEKLACDLQFDEYARSFDDDMAALRRARNLPRYVARMIEALARQPLALRRARAGRAAADAFAREADARRRLEPPADALFAANPTRYAAKLKRITSLVPLSPNASIRTFERYRAALGDVGVDFSLAAFRFYRAALQPLNGFTQRWTAGRLSAADAHLCGSAHVPLSIAVLDDLRRRHDDRGLLALDAYALAAAVSNSPDDLENL